MTVLKEGASGLPLELTASAILGGFVWAIVRVAAPRFVKMLDEREARLRLADTERLERLGALEAEVASLREAHADMRVALATCQAERDVARASLESAQADAVLHTKVSGERLEANGQLSREVERLEGELVSARGRIDELSAPD